MTMPLKLELPKLYTTREAAAILGLSPRTLEGLRVRSSALPYRKLGAGKRSRVMYAEADLIAFVEAAKRTSTSDPGSAA